MLILSRNAPQAASSRLRTHQYIPYLREAGAAADAVAPLFDATYLQHLYAADGRRHTLDGTKACLRRLRALLGTCLSVVWVEKEHFCFLSASFKTLLGVPWVVDYVDATFHTYDHHRRGAECV